MILKENIHTKGIIAQSFLNKKFIDVNSDYGFTATRVGASLLRDVDYFIFSDTSLFSYHKIRMFVSTSRTSAGRFLNESHS